jgi:hypothetical protein
MFTRGCIQKWSSFEPRLVFGRPIGFGVAYAQDWRTFVNLEIDWDFLSISFWNGAINGDFATYIMDTKRMRRSDRCCRQLDDKRSRSRRRRRRRRRDAPLNRTIAEAPHSNALLSVRVSVDTSSHLPRYTIPSADRSSRRTLTMVIVQSEGSHWANV